MRCACACVRVCVIVTFAFAVRCAVQEDTRYVPRVALESLNPDLDFEVVGEEDGALS
jgi:hypothetical protein